MKYIVLESDEVFYDINEVINYCICSDWHEDDDYFETWVNDNYDNVYINGETYYPYDILEAIDSSNLEDLRARYCRQMNDEDRDNAEYELDHADDGDHVEIQGYTVEVREEDDFAAGDTDGDEELPFAESIFKEHTKRIGEAIEEARRQIALKEEEENKAKIEEKATEEDIMKLFQAV